MIEVKRLEGSAISGEADPRIDEVDVRVSEGDLCVVLEICNGSKGQIPLLLSAAASRELAANLLKAADSVES